jgi:hypothetical protein
MAVSENHHAWISTQRIGRNCESELAVLGGWYKIYRPIYTIGWCILSASEPSNEQRRPHFHHNSAIDQSMESELRTCISVVSRHRAGQRSLEQQGIAIASTSIRRVRCLAGCAADDRASSSRLSLPRPRLGAGPTVRARGAQDFGKE